MLYTLISRIVNGESLCTNFLESKYPNEKATIQILSIVKTSKEKIEDPIIITSNATSVSNYKELKTSVDNVLLFGVISENEIVNFDSPEIPLTTNLKQITLQVKNTNHEVLKSLQGFLYIKIDYSLEHF